jgi:hypothetical protein
MGASAQIEYLRFAGFSWLNFPGTNSKRGASCTSAARPSQNLKMRKRHAQPGMTLSSTPGQLSLGANCETIFSKIGSRGKA